MRATVLLGSHLSAKSSRDDFGSGLFLRLSTVWELNRGGVGAEMGKELEFLREKEGQGGKRG